MSWSAKRLDQLGTVSRGRSRHRPRDAAHLYGGPHPFIQTGDVKHAGLYINSFTQTYTEAGLAQSKLWPAGTLCITIAANIADTAILGIDACFPDSVIGFVADPKRADTRFVKYLFDATIKIRAQQFSQGATQDNLSQEKLLSLEFEIPEVEEQKLIADILSSYDDLIDNNRRRMALLEDSARQLYREWFVRLRFPGHEHTPTVDGVPQGWASGVVNDLVDVQSGYAFKTGTYESSGDFGLVTIKNVQDGFFDTECNSFIVEPPKQMPNHCYLKTADILLSLTGNIGRICHVIGDSYLLNQRVAKLVPIKDVPPAFCYFMFRSDEIKGQLNAISYGVAQQNLSPVNMGTLPVSIPPQSLLRMFNDVAEPLVQQLITLKLQSQKLRQARDLLLPRLMNGELTV